MKLAIVHDYLNQNGGAEKVVATLHGIYPDAPIFTSIYLPNSVPDAFKEMDVRTSFMQRLPMISHHARRYLPFYPYAFEDFDLSDYDVVLSSSSAFAKGVITKPRTCHICYCYTPMRFAWNYHTYVQQERIGLLARMFLPYVIHRLRRWDVISESRVDNYIAISMEVSNRIRKYYRRNSTIIYPPVDTKRFTVSTVNDGYFVILSRLLPYKKIDIAIEAFNQLQLPLKIIGDGRDMRRLRKLAGPTVELLGRLPHAQMLDCLSAASAMIFPGLEDFGIAPVEAMACGKPVIAYGGGGALETVLDGETGILFPSQTSEGLIEALQSFDSRDFDPHRIRKHAETFDTELFKERIRTFVTEKYREHQTAQMFPSNGRGEVLASPVSASIPQQGDDL